MSEANGFKLLLRALLVIEVDVGSPRQAVTLVSLETRRFDPGRSPCYSSGLPPDNRGHAHVRSASSAHLNPRRDYRPTTADTLMFAPRAPLAQTSLVGIVQLARTAGLGPADGGSSPSSDSADPVRPSKLGSN